MNEWGLYVHIPFCQARCTYCDFNTVTGMSTDDHRRYRDALIREWENEQPISGPLVSIFFGGGTPSLVDASHLTAVIDAVDQRLGGISDTVEITVETNPGTVTSAKLRQWRQAGVNRLSIGAQALQNHHLLALNRIHDVTAIHSTVAMARAEGFANISLDAIYGLPGQTMEEWQETVAGLLALNPVHLSLYALMVEAGTPLKNQLDRGEKRLPDGDLTADMADWAEVRLEQAGLNPYEISNFARPGMESRHNQLYWQLAPYLALGAGAHAYRPGLRWWNVRGVRRYMEFVESGQDPKDGEERLSPEEEMREYLWLGLRQRRGVSPETFLERFDRTPHEAFGSVLERLLQQGLVESDPTRIQLTRRGRDLASLVARELVDAPVAYGA
ncbi:radical SAM family heme chaperone HemW [Sulfobacillus harzensis]|uniref:Heme chaperone HemW n=1 Tax=Sulfobacillus harzensis TaxID=2729629 RepID=A0A7Y0Q493_9FIRM|nr:radical SAM family heme chaperone HemW [Sulfobacillus harzensis]NMP22999.1 radical SAM family heme chaperone HemW [Sulfobacillus harzensis]